MGDKRKMNNIAIAKFNMHFDNGHFKKNKKYIYNYKKENNEKIFITTEEGKKQEFWLSEFDTLFTPLKK